MVMEREDEPALLKMLGFSYCTAVLHSCTSGSPDRPLPVHEVETDASLFNITVSRWSLTANIPSVDMPTAHKSEHKAPSKGTVSAAHHH